MILFEWKTFRREGGTFYASGKCETFSLSIVAAANRVTLFRRDAKTNAVKTWTLTTIAFRFYSQLKTPDIATEIVRTALTADRRRPFLNGRYVFFSPDDFHAFREFHA